MKEEEADINVRDLIAGIRGVDPRLMEVWDPAGGGAWTCVKCDGWVCDDAPPDECPFCGPAPREPKACLKEEPDARRES